jgi:hypothetical protein
MFFVPGARRLFLFRGLRRLIRTTINAPIEGWWCLRGIVAYLLYRWNSTGLSDLEATPSVAPGQKAGPE